MSYSARRSNKSHRVPNVKLRPRRRTPPPLSTPTSSPPNVHEHEEDLSSSFIDTCPRPLRGVVLCATGVDKSQVFSKAQELGASTSYDFTDRVTHLIAEQAMGQKYQCAVERQIPILRPSWILESHEIWLRGDMFDVAESIDEHRLPIFSSVVLCLSGFTDVSQRTEINRLVTKHGGTYVKELRRPVKVTHLLCSGEVETDKMRYARRFNDAGEASIRLVWEEWLTDSIRYGGRFGEEPYSVDLPRRAPKAPTQPTPGPTIPTTVPDRPEAEEDEVGPVRAHVPAVTLQVWESLLKTRGYVRSADGAKLVRSPRPPAPPPTPTPTQAEPHPDRKGHSALSSFTRNNSFAQSKLASSSKQPFRRTQSLQPEPGPSNPVQAKPPVFAGLRFRALGEAKSAAVRAAVESCLGVWVDEQDVDDDGVDIIIVRLVSGSAIFRAEPDAATRSKYRTECWLEGCLTSSTLLPPTHHLTFTPLAHPTPIPNASSIILSHSGLDAAEETWIKRLTRALGISHAAVFSRANTHLLCPRRKGVKWDKAGEWAVQVVGLDWFAQIVEKGEIPPRKGIVDVTNTRPSAPVRTVPDLPASRAPSRARTAPVDDPEPLGKQTLLLKQTTPAPAISAPQTPLDSGSDTEPEEEEDELPFPPPSARTGVPSSRTPSPMKLPPSPTGSSHYPPSSPPPGPGSSPSPGPRSSPPPELSPVKSPAKSSPMRPIMPAAAARALHESLSILGKRASSSHIHEEEPEPPRRRPRRPRPRPPTTTTTAAPSIPIPIPEVYDTSASYEAPSSLSGRDGMGEMGIGQGMGRGKGAVVTYEDAGQRVERLRLMSLLGEDDDEGGGDDEVGVVENPPLPRVQGRAGGSTRPRPRMVSRAARADVG